jgi:outer membrane protein assembly factor BamA
VKLYPVLNEMASRSQFMGVYAEAGYTIPIRDGILRADVQTVTETTFQDANVIQGVVDADLYFASPRTPIGRVVFAARLVDRYANYLNTVSYLGADTRLRGYPSSYFVGQNLVAANLEYRSRPFEILKVQLAGVAFYDAGQAFDSWSAFNPVHDVGFGVRALFPTFDRIVFRADVGFPISQSPLPAGVGPATFFITFGQAFPLPALGLTSSSVGSLTSSVTR